MKYEEMGMGVFRELNSIYLRVLMIFSSICWNYFRISELYFYYE